MKGEKTTVEIFPQPRREAVLRVTPDFLVALGKGQGVPKLTRLVSNPLPEDATIARIGHDPMSGLLLIILTSESFRVVEPGCQAPPLNDPTWEVLTLTDLAAEARKAADDEDAADAVDPHHGRGSNVDLLRRLADALDPPQS